MGHYIDKDSLEKDIEKRRDNCKKVVWDLRNQENKDYYQGKAEAYSDVLNTISSLDVRDIDLEKEISNYIYTSNGRQRMVLELDWTQCDVTIRGDKLSEFARYFFELGLKAQKG